jgi:GMP synthase (glutamine-hydrolysing)
MPTCLALRHLPFEDLDALAPMLAARGFQVSYLDAPRGQLDDAGRAACSDADLLVVLGGPVGACDEADYPFLLDELAVIEARVAADRPLLGLCLGAQLMARAMGALNLAGAADEIGWMPIELTAAGRASCLAALAGEPVFQWHSDTFELPAGATHLARSAACEHQAFQRGRALALQFHPEVSAEGLEVWYVGHTRSLSDPGSPCIADLRADAARYATALSERLEAVLDAWLPEVGLA